VLSLPPAASLQTRPGAARELPVPPLLRSNRWMRAGWSPCGLLRLLVRQRAPAAATPSAYTIHCAIPRTRSNLYMYSQHRAVLFLLTLSSFACNHHVVLATPIKQASVSQHTLHPRQRSENAKISHGSAQCSRCRCGGGKHGQA